MNLKENITLNKIYNNIKEIKLSLTNKNYGTINQ